MPTLRLVIASATLAALASVPCRAQGRGSESQTALPSIAEKTAGMQKIDGFLPLYWDDDVGRLWMEINRLDNEMIHIAGFGAGLGSNDIGIDRGALAGSRIVKFERVGRKILMVQPNYGFRAGSQSPAEVQAVTDAFARSVLYGFTAAAESDAGWQSSMERCSTHGNSSWECGLANTTSPR